MRLPSRDADGVLYRIPLGWVLVQGRRARPGPPQARRALARGARRPGPACGSTAPPRPAGRTACCSFPTASDTLSDDRWWKNFLGLAAAFAAHARTVSRTLFDQVTGLPQRPEFQAELDVGPRRGRGAQAARGADPPRPGQLRVGQRAPGPPLRRPRAAARSPPRCGRACAAATTSPATAGATFAVILFDTDARRGPDGGREPDPPARRAAVPRGDPAPGVRRRAGGRRTGRRRSTRRR